MPFQSGVLNSAVGAGLPGTEYTDGPFPWTYTVFGLGSNYYARNGTTSLIDYSGTDYNSVLSAAKTAAGLGTVKDLTAANGSSLEVKTIGTGSGLVAPYRPWQFQTTITATDLSTGIAILGVDSNVTYGDAVNGGTGTAHAMTADVLVNGNSDNQSEYACLAGQVKLAGDPFPQSTPGRLWLADMRMHGPITVQPNLMLGWVVFGNNYYNGSPSGGTSALYQALTRPGQGSGTPQSTKDTYPLDTGMIIAGSSGTPGGTLDSRQGFTTGLQIGGSAAAWGVTTSRLGTGISVRDYETAGISVGSPFTGIAAPAISVTAGSPTTYGIDLKGGTYSAASIRLPNNSSIKARNAADGADIDMLFLNTSNVVIFAGGSMRGTTSTLGFFGSAASAKPSITGSRSANAALADLLTKLATLGLITDSTSA